MSVNSGNGYGSAVQDATAVVIVVAATVAATSWGGRVVDGHDLAALYTLVVGYLFGRNTPAP